jgi:hypothetical protein
MTEVHRRAYVVPTVVTLYPDFLVLCPVVTCMTPILTVPMSPYAFSAGLLCYMIYA